MYIEGDAAELHARVSHRESQEALLGCTRGHGAGTVTAVASVLPQPRASLYPDRISGTVCHTDQGP